jgi:hypothetical protein
LFIAARAACGIPPVRLAFEYIDLPISYAVSQCTARIFLSRPFRPNIMPSSITIKLLLRLLFLLCTSSDAFILSASTKSSRGIAPIYYAENGERPSGKEVNVEAIDGHADYMDFLTQDEELCVIK